LSTLPCEIDVVLGDTVSPVNVVTCSCASGAGAAESVLCVHELVLMLSRYAINGTDW
jgi:hypothetical protein